MPFIRKPQLASRSSPLNVNHGHWHSRRIWRSVVALVVTLPLAFSAVYMWMMWDPSSTIGKMPVALVNEDRPAVSGKSTLSAGDQVSRTLLTSRTLGFVEVTRQQAMTGLAAGKYYFVVDIPHDFSSTLASLGSTSMAPALINVMYNDNNTLMASSIGGRVMSAIGAKLASATATTTVGTTVHGLTTLGDGLRSAATGSGQLHTGTSALADGASKLATGLSTSLVPGTTQAAAAGHQLADGTDKLSSGLLTLRSGTDQLGSGATQLADGIDSVVSRVDTTALSAQLSRLQALLPSGAHDPTTAQAAASLTQLEALVNGLDALRTGSRTLARQLSDPNAQYRKGIDTLVDGSQQLSTGATKLSAGLDKINTGEVQAAGGAQKLSDGTRTLDAGAARLSSALSNGVGSLPDLGDGAHQKSLAQLLGTPVSTHTQNLAPSRSHGPGGAPVMLMILSALVPLIVFLCLRPLRFSTAHPRTVGLRPWLRRIGAVTVLSMMGMAVAGAGVWALVDPAPNPAHLGQVIVGVTFATIMNSALVGLLFAVGGYVAGALASLASIMLQVFTFGGVWMVETLPTPLRILHPLMPMTYVRDGMIHAFNGSPGFWNAQLTVIAIAAVITACHAAVVRAPQSTRSSADDRSDIGAPARVTA
ncbi:YhgE/Pip domain-containing protein [Gordonia jinhuaensis]|uniref:Membrane protein n=2 Tax=Gordonia jinhuaensis TaxID=1517702 RepID=A0A916T898_9ACTN|nr:membrane protein [Gordonia jinhuaensis]